MENFFPCENRQKGNAPPRAHFRNFYAGSFRPFYVDDCDRRRREFRPGSLLAKLFGFPRNLAECFTGLWKTCQVKIATAPQNIWVSVLKLSMGSSMVAGYYNRKCALGYS